MNKYSAVNTLSSFETEGLPSDFFVDESESHSEIEPFKIHRKLLRRRHVRKIQKTQERERQQQLEQQQKQKEDEEEERQLTRERQQRRAEEKGEEEKEKTRAFIVRRRHQRSSDEISIISKISNKYDGRKQEEERKIRLMKRYQNKRNNTEAQAQAVAAAAYYGDYYCTCTVTGGATTGTTTNNNITYSPSWMIASTPPTKSLTPKLLSTSHSSTLHENTSCMVTRSMDMNYRRISYTLPEFSPVRPSKFRRLQF